MLRWNRYRGLDLTSNAVDKDVRNLLTVFFIERNISFGKFRDIFATQKLPRIYSGCPFRASREQFYQLVNERVLSHLHGGSGNLSQSSDLSVLDTLAFEQSREAVINIGVIYSLYCFHGLATAFGLPSSIRIGLDTFAELT
jgi:hypothetical protein